MKIRVKSRALSEVAARLGKNKEADNRKNKIRKRIKGGAAAGAVSVGLLLSSLFGSPAELTQNDNHISERPPYVQMVDMEALEEEQDDENIYLSAKSKNGIGNKIKQFILKLPVIVRALVGVPLWAIGWGIISALSLLWQATGAVLLPAIIKFILFALVIFAIIFLIIKAVHPDMPAKKILKKIFRKKNIALIVISAVILSVADAVLISVWKDYGFVRWMIIFVIGLALLFLVHRLINTRRRRRRVA